jgi:hypothetical protein
MAAEFCSHSTKLLSLERSNKQNFVLIGFKYLGGHHIYNLQVYQQIRIHI